MEWKGSYLGFTFGNRHSSDLGIFRTSNSGRYDINLIPQTKDEVFELQGLDGQYYGGSKYTKRDIPISFAFYGLTEEQLALLKNTLNDKKIHNLIFDEEPYKIWSAKLTGIATMKKLCFEDNEQRFYCGEGTLVFTAYYPYARSRFQYIEDYTEINIPEWTERNKYFSTDDKSGVIYPAILEYGYSIEDNTAFIQATENSFKEWLDEVDLLIDTENYMQDINSFVTVFAESPPYINLEEWKEASQIPSSSEYGNYENGKYLLYNAGDIPMPFRLYFPITATDKNFTIQCGDQRLELKGVKSIGEDLYIVIDSQNQIIQGCTSSLKRTKNLYNDKLSGDFFNLPTGEIELKASEEGLLEFNYLYL